MPSFAQQMSQRQVQALAPQLRQRLDVLEASVQELRQILRAEVEQNPVLELAPPEEVSIDAEREDYDRPAGAEEPDFDEALPGDAPHGSDASTHGSDASTHGSADEPASGTEDGPDGADSSEEGEAPPELSSDPDDFSALDALGDDADYLYSEGGNNEYDPDAEERRQFLFDSIPSRESLQAHLLAQLSAAALSDRERAAGEEIVGSIDDDGYLRTPLAEIAQARFLDLSLCERVLRVIQGFTPVGVGARDLRECLLLQLRAADPAPGRDAALRILASKEAFEALAQRRFARLPGLAGVPAEDAPAALAALARLEPAPGRRFSSETTEFVHPEIEVRFEDGRWVAHLDERWLPSVSFVPHWMRRLAELRKPLPPSASPAERAARTEERRYLEQKVRSGKALLTDVSERQNTLRKVAQAIVDAQQDYFEKGPAGLRPLVMAQIAEVVGVHETTVSRAVAGKYVRSPQGIRELRDFFVNGLPSAGGGTASSESVRERLRAMVAAEDPAAPLSDEDIVARFQAEGVTIARRTVAKYRKILRIPSSVERRRV